MKVNKIQIRHYKLGDIIINSEIEKNINEQIGNIVSDYSKYPKYFHAKIVENENGTFNISNINVITPETINVGMMYNSKGNKSFITVITNKNVSEDIIVYPLGIISVTYN